jgi:6-phosphogluconolactonase
MQQGGKTVVYVGTYTRRGSEGIYIYAFDPSTGGLSPLRAATGVVNPTYLVAAPTRRCLYAVNEVSSLDGTPGGAVTAFQIQPGTGMLKWLNQQPSHGAVPCHLSVDQTEQVVLVANYSGGNVAVFPIEPDGRLAPASDVVQHSGSSGHPTRQQGPHPHSITVDPTNRYAIAADLGIDQLRVYRLDLERAKLVAHDVPSIPVRTGASPRHFAFHPHRECAYLINELDSTVTALRYDADRGRLDARQTISTLPRGFEGENTCADLHLSPSGRFLYGSNRGHDSIAAFRVDEATGRLTAIGHTSTRGKTPRNFGIDPSGRYLLAANEGSDTVVAYWIDEQSGQLEATGAVTQVPMPVCVLFVPLPEDAS